MNAISQEFFQIWYKCWSHVSRNNTLMIKHFHTHVWSWMTTLKLWCVCKDPLCCQVEDVCDCYLMFNRSRPSIEPDWKSVSERHDASGQFDGSLPVLLSQSVSLRRVGNETQKSTLQQIQPLIFKQTLNRYLTKWFHYAAFSTTVEAQKSSRK